MFGIDMGGSKLIEALKGINGPFSQSSPTPTQGRSGFMSQLVPDSPSTSAPNTYGTESPKSQPLGVAGMAGASNVDEQLKAAALPRIEDAIKSGTMTKDKFVQQAITAENASRSVQGNEPLTPAETEQEVKRQESMWTKLSLPGKAGLVFATSLAAGLASRGLMQEDKNRITQQVMGGLNAAIGEQALLDKKYEDQLAAQQARQDKLADNEAKRKGQFDVANVYADATKYAADSRLRAAKMKLDDTVDKPTSLTPNQLEDAVDSSLIGAGFMQHSDKKGKVVDPNFANAKGQIMSLFNAYRNSPKYKGVSDGQILQALLKQHVVQGTPDTNRIPFMDNSTPPSFRQQ